MRKISKVAPGLIVAAVFLLSGCGGDGPKMAPSTDPNSQPTPMKGGPPGSQGKIPGATGLGGPMGPGGAGAPGNPNAR